MEPVNSIYHCGSIPSGGVAFLKRYEPQTRSRQGNEGYKSTSRPLSLVAGLGDSTVKQFSGSWEEDTDDDFGEEIVQLDSACTSITTNQESIIVATSLRGQVLEITLKDVGNEKREWSLGGVPTCSCLLANDIIVGFEAGRIQQLRSPYTEPVWQSSLKTSTTALTILEQMVLSVGPTGLSAYDLRTSEKVQSMFYPAGFACITATRETSSMFATGDHTGAVHLWDVRNLARHQSVSSEKRHKGWVSALRFIGDSPNQIVSAGSDGLLVLTGSHGRNQQMGPITSLATIDEASRTLIAAAQGDGLVRVFATAPLRRLMD